MSVVNKMLQDLEARKFETEAVNADYHPPQKKQSKLLVLVLLSLTSLILIISTITFALTGKSVLFDKNNKASVTTTAILNKVDIISKKVLQQPFQPQVTAVQSPQTQLALVAVATDTGLSGNVSSKKQQHLRTPEVTLNKPASMQSITTQDEQVELQNNIEGKTKITAEPTSSFSMSGGGQDNNGSDLKRRITKSLDDDNFDLAQPLLNELLVIEPSNVKARKKLASLFFAQGNYMQSKQILLQGMQLHPSRSDLRLMLARLHMAQKESAQAINVLIEFQPNAAEQIEYLAYRASLAQQLEYTALAMSDYQILTNVEPSNAKWWLGLAIIKDQSGETTMALQAYNKAGKLSQLDNSVNNFIQQRILVLAGAP
jgi:MSHA biogenesis protein MshN